MAATTGRNYQLEISMRAKKLHFKKRLKRRLLALKENTLFQIFIALLFCVHIGGFIIFILETDPSKTAGNIIQDWGVGIWWAFITVFTIGYGDFFPVTAAGRVTATFIGLFGISIIAVLTATISSKFVEQRLRKGQGLEKVKLKGHIVICGWNFNIENIILTLEKELDYPSIVLVNSSDPGPVSEIISRHTESEISFVAGDFSKDAILERASIRQAESVIIVADINEITANKTDEKTIITSLTVKNMNPKVRLYAHIINPDNVSHLRRAKADDVVISDKYSGFLLAMHVTGPGVPRVVDELLTFSYGNEIVRMDIPDEFIGKTFGQLCSYFSEKKRAILIGVTRESKGMALNDLLSDDNSYLDQFIRKKLQESGKKFAEEERLAVNINPGPDYIIEKNNVAIAIAEKY
ncbi:NAD-binding protein [bacterium]|nr:NAD-binding protein [bacterium]